jgi:DNA-binding transcriptional LysR family regulator
LRASSLRRAASWSPRRSISPGRASPEDLAHHRCLNYGHSTALQRWQLTRDGHPHHRSDRLAPRSNNGDVLKAAVLNEQGITNLPTFLVGPDIKARRLRLVMPDLPSTELGIYALYAPNRYLAATTRVLIDFLAAISRRGTISLRLKESASCTSRLILCS